MPHPCQARRVRHAAALPEMRIVARQEVRGQVPLPQVPAPVQRDERVVAVVHEGDVPPTLDASVVLAAPLPVRRGGRGVRPQPRHRAPLVPQV